MERPLKLQVQNGIRVEQVGDDVIVLDREGTCVHRLSGDGAAMLRLAVQGIDEADVPPLLVPALVSLADVGIVAVNGWSRRRLLKMGGAGVAAAGITTFALATSAAAASPCPAGNGAETFNLNSNFIVPAGVNRLLVQSWGGGGFGGDGQGNGGGGGGGGGFTQVCITRVVTGQTYAVTVGASTTVASPAGKSSFIQLGAGAQLATANGGGAGSKSAGGAGGAGTTTSGGAGGFDTGGSAGGAGGGGSGGASTGGGIGGIGVGGAGGAGGALGTGTPSGASGGAGGASGTGGLGGVAPGGGGGGAGKGNATVGGAGAAGRVIIKY